MTKIEYTVGTEKGAIYWAASEHFDELAGQKFALGEMEAVKIAQMTNLSSIAQILLSAVAGAIIQHLLDAGIAAEQIFAEGNFWVATA